MVGESSISQQLSSKSAKVTSQDQDEGSAGFFHHRKRDSHYQGESAEYELAVLGSNSCTRQFLRTSLDTSSVTYTLS
jgi:hypothetical protein